LRIKSGLNRGQDPVCERMAQGGIFGSPKLLLAIRYCTRSSLTFTQRLLASSGVFALTNTSTIMCDSWTSVISTDFDLPFQSGSCCKTLSSRFRSG
jgi:hypothetical protein